MKEYFRCEGCGNHNLIDWEGRGTTNEVFPCVGCSWTETYSIITFTDGSTARFDRNNQQHVDYLDEAGNACLSQAVLPHGKLIVAEQGKGELHG